MIVVILHNDTNYKKLSEEIKPTMEESIERAVKLLAEKITGDIKSDDALKFTQAALNLEHVLAVKSDIEERKK